MCVYRFWVGVVMWHMCVIVGFSSFSFPCLFIFFFVHKFFIFLFFFFEVWIFCFGVFFSYLLSNRMKLYNMRAYKAAQNQTHHRLKTNTASIKWEKKEKIKIQKPKREWKKQRTAKPERVRMEQKMMRTIFFSQLLRSSVYVFV